MAVAGRARELLLPLLFLPLAIPIVVGGVGASVARRRRYLAFLALYDIVFALLSWASSSTSSPRPDACRHYRLRSP